MSAEILRVDPLDPDPAALARAAAALREGRLAVFRTETVYGLAARTDRPGALAALRAAKGRGEEKPLSLHLPSVEALHRRFPGLPEAPARLAGRRLPGPLTLVLPDPAGGFTGVRVPDDPVARAVLEAAGVPVAATSVNAAGEPPAVTGEEAARFAADLDAVVLDAGPCRLGAPSTVVRFEGDRVEVLREGAVPAAEVLADAARLILFVCTGNLCRSPLAEALAARLLAGARATPPPPHPPPRPPRGAPRPPPAALPPRGRACGSAGTAARDGDPASPESVREGARRGADLRAHRSRGLTFALVERAHRVYTMERGHRDSILDFLPGAAERVLVLDPEGRDVPDPFHRGAAAYARAADLIDRALRARAGDGSLEG